MRVNVQHLPAILPEMQKRHERYIYAGKCRGNVSALPGVSLISDGNSEPGTRNIGRLKE